MPSNLFDSFEPTKKKTEEKIQILSIKFIGFKEITAKKGYKFNAMHVKYLNHGDPYKAWKDKLMPAKSKQARLIAHSGPFDSSEQYHVRSIKKSNQPCEWTNIELVSKDTK